MTFVPSVYQQRFFDAVASGRGNYIVNAVAGSGKSTSIEKALPYIRKGAWTTILAFGHDVAKEWKEVRLPRVFAEHTELDPKYFKAATFHSICFGAICKHLGLKPNQVNTDGKKSRKLLREILPESEVELYSDYVTKLVGLAKGEGIGCLVPDTDDAWWNLVEHHDLYLSSEDADERTALMYARQLLSKSNEVAKSRNWIDYDDMLFLVCLWRLRLFQVDVLLVDEAQDTNVVRRAIIRLALRPGGRLFAVGDPRQAIMGFTGASHDALDLISKAFKCEVLPLSVCYRCASDVVTHAKEIVPHIEAAPNATKGSVSYTGVSLEEGLKAGTFQTTFGPHDAILCRNTSPLIELAYTLIAKKIGCRIAGKDIAEGLVNLIRSQKAAGVDRLITKLEAWRDKQVAKFTAKGEEEKADAITDRVACVLTVVENMPPTRERTIPELVRQLESMFSDENGVLTLLTIHKAKGKEYPIVGIYRPELSPSKWARQDWQQLQEMNLMYVARTRAKEQLVYLSGEAAR